MNLKIFVSTWLAIIIQHCCSVGALAQGNEITDQAYDSIYSVVYELMDTSPDSALVKIDSLYSATMNNGNARQQGWNHHLKGEAYYSKNELALAWKYYKKGIKIFDSIADSEGRAEIFNSLGNLAILKGQPKESLFFYRKAYNLFKGKPEDQLVKTQNIARTLIEIDSVQAAYKYINKMKSDFKSLNDSQAYYYAIECEADILYYKNELNKCIDLVKKCTRYYSRKSYKSYLLFEYYYLADCYLYLKNTARAEFYINKALEVEKIVSPGSFDNYYYILLERLCLVKGDYKGAYDASATYYSLISKVKELDNSYLSTIYDELAFENKLKQEKLKQDLLKKDAAAKLENAKKVRYSLYAVIIIIMISSIFLVVGLRGYKKLSAKLKVQNKTAELTNKELEKSVSLKEKLIGIIAHDTRSPLAATASALELINMNELDDDEKTMILTALESKTKNALEEADNVIKWAKAQLQGIEIENKVVALKDIVDPAIENIIPRFESKQIKFKSLLTDKCKVYGDPNLLKHVIKNLLVNSGKFSYEHDEVVIKSEGADGFCHVKIIDNGIGMTDEQKEKLFTLNMTTTKGTQNERGTGLGLLQCYEFVNKMGGKIEVDSTKHVGTVFTLILPSAM